MNHHKYLSILMPLICILATEGVQTSIPTEDPLQIQMPYRSRNLQSTGKMFLPGPKGQTCILDDQYLFDLTYGQGRCRCDLCKPGQFVQRLCQCGKLATGDSPPQNNTVCAHVEVGVQYMNGHNFCTAPFMCATGCKEHQIKASNCTHRSDFICKCEEGWYDPDPADAGTTPRECLPKPRCPAGQEPQQNHASTEVEYVCEWCREGYYKFNGDSAESCKPHRVCETRSGDGLTDNECLNDDLLLGETQIPHSGEPPPSAPEKFLQSTSASDPQADAPPGLQHTTRTGEDRNKTETTKSAPAPDVCSTCPSCTAAYAVAIGASLLWVLLIAYGCISRCKLDKKKQGPNAQTTDAEMEELQRGTPTTNDQDFP